VTIAALQSQVCNRGLRPNWKAWPLEKDEFHQPGELRDIFPKMQLGQLVSTDNPVELIVWVERPEIAHRINRVADAAAPQLDVGDLESVIPLNRGPQHGQSILDRGLDIVWF
jgi:hypothetical protein